MTMRTMCAVAAVGLFAGPSMAAVSYFLDDGSPELGLSIEPGESILFLNSFPVIAGGQYINRISCAWGRAGGGFVSSSFTATLLLYSDANGGDPTDATLALTHNVVMTNAGTNAIVNYLVPSTFVTGTMWVGFIYDNTGFGGDVFVGSLDTTSPTLTQRSYFGYKAGQINPANLSAIPSTQRMFQEESMTAQAGNYLIRAVGQPTPAPGAAALLVMGAVIGLKRRRE